MEQALQTTRALLEQIRQRHRQSAYCFGFAAEDTVLLDLIQRHLDASIFVLDSGRLPQASLQLLDEVEHLYGKPIQRYRPQTRALNEHAQHWGETGFRHSIAARKHCCQVRKLEPLRRALAGKDAWLTSLRRQPALGQAHLPASEWDRSHGLVKFHPLRHWSHGDIWAYIFEHDLPYNDLHDQGYPLVGCQPCIRPVTTGHNIRSGRWWWEQTKPGNDTHPVCMLVEQQEPAVMA